MIDTKLLNELKEILIGDGFDLDIKSIEEIANGFLGMSEIMEGTLESI